MHRQLHVNDTEITRLRQSETSLEVKLCRARSTGAHLRDEIALLKATNGRLESDLVDCTAELDRMIQAIADSEEKWKSTVAELESQLETTGDALKTKGRMEAQLRDSQHQLSTTMIELNAMTAAANNTQIQLDHHLNDAEITKANMEDLNIADQKLATDKADLEHQLTDAKITKANMEDRLNIALTELATLKNAEALTTVFQSHIDLNGINRTTGFGLECMDSTDNNFQASLIMGRTLLPSFIPFCSFCASVGCQQCLIWTAADTAGSMDFGGEWAANLEWV